MTQVKKRLLALIPFLVSLCFLSTVGVSAQAADHISGEWKINSANYTGKIEFSGDYGKYSGRIFYDVVNRWENLTNIRFEPGSG